jgi:hypothetical protein
MVLLLDLSTQHVFVESDKHLLTTLNHRAMWKGSFFHCMKVSKDFYFFSLHHEAMWTSFVLEIYPSGGLFSLSFFFFVGNGELVKEVHHQKEKEVLTTTPN